MQPLSERLSELSAQAKKAEDRVARAQAETKDRLEQQRDEAHREAQAALDKVSETLSRASEGTRSAFAQLKSKVDSDFERMKERGAEFEEGVRRAAEKHNVAVTVNRVGSMWTIFFHDGAVYDFDSANRSNRDKFARFLHLMLDEGVYLPPSQMEAAFFSAAHAKKDILQLIERVEKALKKVAWEFEK